MIVRNVVVPTLLSLAVAVSATAAPPAEVTITSKSAAAIAAFKAGRDLFFNLRAAEADAQFRKAVAADPKFAQALAYLAAGTPGGEGQKLMAEAEALSKGLPEAERLLIESFAANQRGDEARARAATSRVAELAPGDWRAQFALGQQLSASREWPAATAAFEKAIALNPKAGASYNSIGYAHLAQNHTADAVAAFRKYAEVNPAEPNAHDSLGEALVRDGKYAEAEAAFQQALKISPQFWNAWEGISKARFLKGDAAGSYEALAKARQTAERPIDKLGTTFDEAWSQFAEGKKTEAIATLEKGESDATTQKVDLLVPFMALSRATMLTESGKPEEALKVAATAVDRASAASLPGGTMGAVRRAALANRINAQARLGQSDEAQRTLALLEEEARKVPASAQAQSTLEFARGEAALARGDVPAAIAAFAKCTDDDTYCQWQLAVAQEKSGDAAAAAATRGKLLASNRRSDVYLYVRARARAN